MSLKTPEPFIDGREDLIDLHHFAWIKANRRRANGLYWFAIPGASGMDNAPRGGVERNGAAMCHVDLSFQQALSARIIARMADVAGDAELKRRMTAEADELDQLINSHMWHDRSGFYYDIFTSHPQQPPNVVNHKTVAGFWPLLSGTANHRQALALVDMLLDPKTFWRRDTSIEK